MQCSDYGPELSVEILGLFQKKYGNQPYEKDGYWMARMAAFRMEEEQWSWCRLPFTNTVEKEALSENVSEKIFPAPSVVPVYEAIQCLCKEEFPVCLQVTGTVTVMMELMGSHKMIRCYRKEPDEFWTCFDQITNFLVEYAQAAVDLGVHMISYGDPSGTKQIMGPDFFERVTAMAASKFCDQIKGRNKDLVVHLCPQLTTSLLDLNQLVEIERRPTSGLTYGKQLLNLANNTNKIWMTGKYCLKLERSIVPFIPIYQWSKYSKG